jgi:DNA modification methylase
MFYIKGKCKVVNANCFDVLKRMPDSCIDVTFTSPPFNRKRNDTYKYYDDILEQYYEMLVSLTEELIRVTRGYVILNLQPNYYCKTDENAELVV